MGYQKGSLQRPFCISQQRFILPLPQIRKNQYDITGQHASTSEMGCTAEKTRDLNMNGGTAQQSPYRQTRQHLSKTESDAAEASFMQSRVARLQGVMLTGVWQPTSEWLH